jgi:hypothetical protein
MKSPGRRICSRSTPRWKPHAPEKRAAALPWLPLKCAADGVELVNQAGTALTDIVDSIKAVASIIAEIASASSEQATGLDEINKAMGQMDEVTQQNSALVEENAATAKALEHQATSMREQVDFFKVDAVDGGVAGIPSPTQQRHQQKPRLTQAA